MASVKRVKVQAIERLYVAGRLYAIGETFEIGMREARALGSSVKVLRQPPENKAITCPKEAK